MGIIQIYSKYTTKTKVNALLYAICTIIYVTAFCKDNIALSNHIPYTNYLGWICVAAIIFNSVGRAKIDKTRRKLLCPVLLFLFFTSFHVMSGYGSTIDKLMFLYLPCFVLLSEDNWLDAYRIFRSYVVISCIIGIICYFSFVLSLGLPFNLESYYSERQVSSSYANYYLSLLYISTDGLRLCGVFHEPGILGTVCAFLLVIDNLELKRKSNWIILIAMILSWSMAAFLMVAAYFLLTSYNDRKRIWGIAISIAIIVFVLPNIKTDNANINHIIERFQIEDNQFVGDTRSNDLIDNEFNQMYDDVSTFIFGHGAGYKEKLMQYSDQGVSTFKIFVLEHGWLGFILTNGLFFYFCIAFSKKNKYGIYLSLIWLLSLYGNDGKMYPQTLVLIVGGLTYLNEIHLIENNNTLQSNG